MQPRVIPDPETLLQDACKGGGPAFGLLLESCRGYLTLLARVQIGRRLQGKVDASDLVQETFLAAHRDFRQFRGATEKEFAGWLRNILACRLGDVIRRYYASRCRDVRLERQLAEEIDQSAQSLELIAEQSTPSEHVCRREQAVMLADALGRLPAEYGEVIVMRHLEGMRFPQIAERMGRTVDSVEKLWVRGLARLRRTLGGGT
jgi:RNA polymerase sigma-70 factor (ECF subfamily)